MHKNIEEENLGFLPSFPGPVVECWKMLQQMSLPATHHATILPCWLLLENMFREPNNVAMQGRHGELSHRLQVGKFLKITPWMEEGEVLQNCSIFFSFSKIPFKILPLIENTMN